MKQRSERDKLQQTLAELKLERSSWDAHWMEIERCLLPRAGRFDKGNRNNGERRNQNIYDNTATRALRILGAGLMSGATNPSQPWFRLMVADRKLMERESVKVWLNEVTEILHQVFAASNTYRAFHTIYEELGAFGTGCSIIVDSYEKVMHHNTLTIGEYSLGTDYMGNVNRLAREMEMMVSQVVGRFGYENCSYAVRNMYDQGNYTAWVPVVHIIEPRDERNPKIPNAKNMAFKSVYFEEGRESNGDRFLRESGFKDFRALTPRWHVTSNDIYGHSCGMDALGDIKQLQHEQLRKAEGIDYKTKPPLQVPTRLKGNAINRLPGGITPYDSAAGPQAGIRSLFEVNLDLSHLLADIQDVRERVKDAFYTPLFFGISQNNAADTRMTATEIAARNQEALLQLGPVLERLHNEQLNPTIDIGFARLVEARGPRGESVLPPPPPELEGQELKVEYMSILAQAQRAVNVNSIDRYVVSLGQIAMVKPAVLDKFNEDKWAEIYADSLGVDPELIVADKQVALIRQSRVEAQKAMQQQAMMQSAADTAQKLSQTNTGEKNALTDIAQQV